MDSEIPNGASKEKHSPVLNGTGKGLIFEIVSVAIFLVVIFGILSYFNILKLSEIFPNYLGFLPHRAYKQSQQYNNATITPATSLTQQAKETLMNYLPAIVVSSLIPQSLSEVTFVKEKAVKEEFSAIWNTKENGTVKVVFTPSTSQKSIDSFNIALHKTHSEPPSKEIAQSLFPKAFFISPKGEWRCSNIPDSKRLYCENFWEEENGARRGIGLLGYHPDSTLKTSTILFCEHTKESKLYPWKSCSYEFAKTGVQ